MYNQLLFTCYIYTFIRLMDSKKQYRQTEIQYVQYTNSIQYTHV